MAIVQTLIERPRLRRWFSVDQFADPLNCLKGEYLYLQLALNLLENLADNLQVAERDEHAASILDYLSTDLSIHAEDAEALIELLEAKAEWSDDVRAVCDELRAEQTAIQRLLPSVTDGLVALSNDMLPSSPQEFVVSAFILVEFLRMHVEFEKNSVLELSEAILTREDLENLGRDMAFRRGMGPVQ